MKNMTKALMIGGLMVVAQTALASDSVFPRSIDEAGGRLPPRLTHADRHASDPVTTAGSAFAGRANSSRYLRAKTTYADLHSKDPVTSVASAFPGAAEDGFIQLSAKSTFADRNLDKPTRISQPGQDSGISAN